MFEEEESTVNDLKLTEKGTAENILDADSGITYKYIKDICNECFGKNYKAYQRGHYNINDYYMAWFPKMAIEENGRKKPGSKTKNWINILGDNGNTIIEYNYDEPADVSKKLENMIRLVFGKSKGEEYRFLGVFKTVFSGDSDAGYARYIHKRVASRIDITKLNKDMYCNYIQK